MDNRFFDIDSNVYLNSIYILCSIYKSDRTLSIKDILFSLYLIKSPSISLALLDGKSKLSFKKKLHAYDFNNIQSEMIKYTSKIFTDGLYESLSFLFGKNLITYDINSSLVYKSENFDKLNFKRFPKDLIYKADYANKIIRNYSQIELESKINNLWKVLL